MIISMLLIRQSEFLPDCLVHRQPEQRVHAVIQQLGEIPLVEALDALPMKHILHYAGEDYLLLRSVHQRIPGYYYFQGVYNRDC